MKIKRKAAIVCIDVYYLFDSIVPTDIGNMGNWQMEVGRMMLYVSFPVGIFHYFNHTENIEEWLVEQRKKHFSSNQSDYKEFMQYIEQFNSEKRAKQLDEIEQRYRNMTMK